MVVNYCYGTTYYDMVALKINILWRKFRYVAKK